MNQPLHRWKTVLAGIGALALWWGLDVAPHGTDNGSEGIDLLFFGMNPVTLDRAFFMESGQALLLSGVFAFLIVLVCAFVLYSLLDLIFSLKTLSPRQRLGFFGLLVVLLLVDFNPLIALFLGRIPANFTVFALDAARSITSLAAVIGGLGAACLVPVKIRGLVSRLVMKPAFVVVVGTAALSFVVWMRNDPLMGLAAVSDELSYLRQAEIFLDGHLAEPSFEPLAFFDADQMINDGRYYGKYPPGTSLCLLPALASGFPQAAPVGFLVLNLCLIGLLARRLFGRETALLSVLLACASPFIVCMGESFLSHGPGLSAALGMAWFHTLWLERRKPGYTLLSGFCAGVLLLIRPVTALALILPFFVHGQIAFRGTKVSRAISVLLFVLVLASFTGAFLWYNHAQTGDASLMPYQKYASMYAPFDRFGFDNLGQGSLNTAFNLSRLNRWLFGFAPSLLPIAALFLFGAFAAWDLLFLAAFLLLAAGHLFHWFWGTPWFGPLYYYECAGFLVIIAARGILKIGEKREVIHLAVLCVLAFAAPLFCASQAQGLGKRTRDIWGPVKTVQVEEGSWVIMEDEPPFKARYLGAAPRWMTGGFRVLNSGSPADLRALHPEKRIYVYRNGKLEKVP